MVLRSSFKADLKKEQQLYPLLDSLYTNYLKRYIFSRVSDYQEQLKGIDLLFMHKVSGQRYFIDEKAQLDYVNDDLPTFAFEIQYLKKGQLKEGWLFDESKATHFYSLITAIYQDSPHTFTSCKITLVNRRKLIAFLADRQITKEFLASEITKYPEKNAKLELYSLDPGKEGYLYFSTKNKAEKPINLILKLDFLIASGIAKRLV